MKKMTLEEFKKANKTFEGKQLLHAYQNGNHYTAIYNDGTRIRETIDSNADRFLFSVAENADVKITGWCDAGCPFCHEGSSKEGKHASLKSYMKLWDTWEPGTEIAIGGGNALAHPDIEWFLEYLSNRGVICNLTVNQHHLPQYQYDLVKWASKGWLHGLGVSVVDPNNRKELDCVANIKAAFLTHQKSNNVVFHVIAGILNESFLKSLANEKVLILGYKDNIGRGVTYKKSHKDAIDKNIEWLAKNLKSLSQLFAVMSFDNLSLAQLDARRTLGLSDEEWNLRFQGKDYGDPNGEDAPSTFYFDAVEGEIGRSSTQPKNQRIKYDFVNGMTFKEAFKASLSNYKINEGEYGEIKE